MKLEDWYIGLKVWDVREGEGAVREINDGYMRPILVEFKNGIVEAYTVDGVHHACNVYRSLYFSEPKVEGLLVPPKKFEPTLKNDDVIIFTYKGYNIALTVEEENEHHIKGVELIDGALCHIAYRKSDISNVRKISAEVINLTT